MSSITNPTTSLGGAASAPKSTIAPYYTGLNGVDLPANMRYTYILWGTLGIVVVIIFALRVLEAIWNKMRQSAILLTPLQSQLPWRQPRTGWTARVKKHLIYASLWKKRHHREYRFCSLNLGTLPSRLHVIAISLYIASNIVYLALLRRHHPNKYAIYAELRGRSGTLCVANMVPLIILAGRNNPLIYLLRISFDTYNLFHRWIGRMAVVHIIIHAICWAVPVVADGGWRLVRQKLSDGLFIISGFTGVLSMLLIVILASSPLRHAFYETFLNIHILLAAVVFACTWMHCVSSIVKGGLPQLPWIMTIVYLWAAERLIRIIRTVYLNWSGNMKGSITRAHFEAMPGDMTRVTVHLPRHVDIKPGTHAYLRFWDLHPWQSHPFSIAWVDHHERSGLPISERKESSSTIARRNTNKTLTTSATFIVSAQGGITRKLLNMALSDPRGVSTKALMEGPYAGYHSLDSYGHVLLIAGAGGITHQISYLRPLLEASNAGTVATQRMTLVWIVREYDSLELIRPHLESLYSIPHSHEKLCIKIFVTRPRNATGSAATSISCAAAKVAFGRPTVKTLVAEEIENQIGAMCVSVCGPGSLTDDVRESVRDVQGASVVDFVEESFTW